MAANFDKVIASATLAGSLLSCVATTCVLTSFAIYRHQMRSFRHALVLNLSVAEFINSLNNTVSGFIYMRTRGLQPGAACTVNGFVGQLSVQAADFSILAIALVTLLTVTGTVYMPKASLARKATICGAVWVVPVATSVTATAMGQMAPVGGNWCWISAARPDLRDDDMKLDNLMRVEAAGAGTTTKPAGLSISVHEVKMDAAAVEAKGGMMDFDDDDDDDDATTLDEMIHGTPGKTLRQQKSFQEDLERITPKSSYPGDNHVSIPRPSASASGSVRRAPNVPANRTMRSTLSEFPIRQDSHQVEREIKKMMFLNAYPIMYVLLWIPGLVNRLLQASGNAPGPRTMAALQVSTQMARHVVGLEWMLTWSPSEGSRPPCSGFLPVASVDAMSLGGFWEGAKGASRWHLLQLQNSHVIPCMTEMERPPGAKNSNTAKRRQVQVEVQGQEQQKGVCKSWLCQ
ncbi:conserved hypothetical protein [Verticillium alfalfae VaMs.102]|uniref:Glucose receptor Git3-like N-terminal domain-containing protein n=1 Tax=Verticillium alfalfae (strain VaMs.102 / ATCC MYA-4576 / FGSC 10136) TaxID=526221 RepID=C9S604_VERA1|nr:conserved hypothetical protein [Verticillium alfalfae VaMs.102]EEY14343.1 conserved hypothetical protein [Verticillium alfalfae VaMs.102]